MRNGQGPPGDPPPARRGPVFREASGSLSERAGATLPARTPGLRLGPEPGGPEVGPVAGALPVLQQCIFKRWVWSALCLKPFPCVGSWWSLTVKAGGEQDGCCDLRGEAGEGCSLHAFPPWLCGVEALSNLGNRWVAGSWGGQGPGLAWGAGSPPLALGHRPECPGGFASSPGV